MQPTCAQNGLPRSKFIGWASSSKTTTAAPNVLVGLAAIGGQFSVHGSHQAVRTAQGQRISARTSSAADSPPPPAAAPAPEASASRRRPAPGPRSGEGPQASPPRGQRRRPHGVNTAAGQAAPQQPAPRSRRPPLQYLAASGGPEADPSAQLLPAAPGMDSHGSVQLLTPSVLMSQRSAAPDYPPPLTVEAAQEQLEPRWQSPPPPLMPLSVSPQQSLSFQSAPPPPPPPMGVRPGPPAGSVMSGWGLAGGQPHMNSVYRLIRMKELQHHHHHHHHPSRRLGMDGPEEEGRGEGASSGSPGGGGGGRSSRGSPRGRHPASERGPPSPPWMPPKVREMSPRLGDLRPYWQYQQQQQQGPGPELEQEYQAQDSRDADASPQQHHPQPHQPPPRSGSRSQQWTPSLQSEREWKSERRPGAPREPPGPQPAPPPLPPPLPSPFSSGHPAVDRVVRIRQIQMRMRRREQEQQRQQHQHPHQHQQRAAEEGGGGYGGGVEEDIRQLGRDNHSSGAQQAEGARSSRSAQLPLSVGRADGGAAPTVAGAGAGAAAGAGAWAADRVPTALLGGRGGRGGQGGQRVAPMGRQGATSRGDAGGGGGLIEVTLAGPSQRDVAGGAAGGAGGGGGGVEGDGDGDGGGVSGVSGLLRESLISDLSLLNPVYRMIRKHELLQRRPHPGPARGAAASPSPSGASSPMASTDPWGADDFADVMLGGLTLPPPPLPPLSSSGGAPAAWGSTTAGWGPQAQELVLEDGEGDRAAVARESNRSRSGSNRAGGAWGQARSPDAGTEGQGGQGGPGGEAGIEYGDGYDKYDEEQRPAQHLESAGRSNPVLRLIRKKELQRRLRLRGPLAPEPPPVAPVAVGAAGGESPQPHWGKEDAAGGAGAGSSDVSVAARVAEEPATAEAEAAEWEIGPRDAVGGRAVMNPVYRLIRKKQLQSRRASREAAATAAAAAAASVVPGSDGHGGGAASKEPPSSGRGAADSGWAGLRAPFFNLDFGPFSLATPSLAEALDPATGPSSGDLGAGAAAAPGGGSSPGEELLLVRVPPDLAGASRLRAPGGTSPPSPPPPPLPQARVSDELLSSMVGERPHMNQVYRLIRKKELQLRQRGLLPRQGPPPPPPAPEGGAAASLGADCGAQGRAPSTAGTSSSLDVSAFGAVPPLLPLRYGTGGGGGAAAAAALPPATQPAGPPAMLHPFDPVDEPDRGSASPLTLYGSRLLLLDTYDTYDDDEQAGDDEGAFWSADESASSWWDEGGEQEAGGGDGRIDLRQPSGREPPTPAPAPAPPPASAWAASAAGAVLAAKPLPAAGQIDNGATALRSPAAVSVQRRGRGRPRLAAAGEVAGRRGQGQGQRRGPGGSMGLGSQGAAQALEATDKAAGDEEEEAEEAQQQQEEEHEEGKGGAQAGRGPARRRRIQELKASLRAKLLHLLAPGQPEPERGAPGSGEAAAGTLAGIARAHPGGAPAATAAGATATTAGAVSAAIGAGAAQAGKSDPASAPSSGFGSVKEDGGPPSDPERRQDRGMGVAAPGGSGLRAVTARPLPWQIASRRSDGGGGGGSTAAAMEIRRKVGPAVRRPPGLMRFLMEATLEGSGVGSVQSSVVQSYDVRGEGQSDDGRRTGGAVAGSGGGGGGGGDVGSAASGPLIRPVRRRLFSGIAQLWDDVGLRVGPSAASPPPHPQQRLPDSAGGAAAGVARGLTRLEELLVREGVSANTARRVWGSWLVQSRGWAAREVVARLRRLQRVLEEEAVKEDGPVSGLVPEQVQGGDPQVDPEQPGAGRGPEMEGGAGSLYSSNSSSRGRSGDIGASGLTAAAAAAAKQPNLLTREPEALEANLEAMAAALGISRSEAQRLARTYPSLLELRAGSLEERLASLSQSLGVPSGVGGADANQAWTRDGDGDAGGGDGDAPVGLESRWDSATATAAAAAERGLDPPSAQAAKSDRDGGFRSAAGLVLRYPPALALTPSALTARLGALTEAITVSMEMLQRRTQTQTLLRGPAGEPELQSVSPRGAVTHDTGTAATAVVPAAAAAADVDAAAAVTGDAAALRAAAAARAQDLVWGQPGLLGFGPGTLAARWRALEEAVARAEAQLQARAGVPPAAAAAVAGDERPPMSPGGVESRQTSADAEQGERPVAESPLEDDDHTVSVPWCAQGHVGSGPSLAPTRGSRPTGPLAWRRQLLEGPPASVARCLASSVVRQQRLAFLAALAAAGEGAGDPGIAVRRRGRPRKSVAGVPPQSPALRSLTEGEEPGGAASGEVEIEVSDVAAAPAGALLSPGALSLSTVLGMSDARFNQRFPAFQTWSLQQPQRQRQQQEEGLQHRELVEVAGRD